MARILLVFFLVVTTPAFSQQVTLSPRAEVSVITCGPGQEEVYLAFGHSAIRVSDPANKIDYAYNYGVFDFDQPHFYLNYTRGLLLFKLGVYDYPDFVNAYMYRNRSVTEQVLDLTPSQKQKVFDFLEWNAQPERETYRYDYFYNNCANKVRDVFANVLKDSIQFDGSFITTDYTVRQLTDLYTQQQPWGDLAIDICLGLPIDKKAAPYEYMYLPDYVMAYLDHSTIVKAGAVVPAVKIKNIVYSEIPRDPPTSPLHPWVIFGGFLALTLAISYYDWRRKKLSKWFDVILFTTLGMVGVLLGALWIFTDHEAAANNMNILWALPVHLVVLMIFWEKFNQRLKRYFSFVSIFTLVLLISWAFLPQQMNVVLLPFVASIGLRAWMISRLL